MDLDTQNRSAIAAMLRTVFAEPDTVPEKVNVQLQADLRAVENFQQQLYAELRLLLPEVPYEDRPLLRYANKTITLTLEDYAVLMEALATYEKKNGAQDEASLPIMRVLHEHLTQHPDQINMQFNVPLPEPIHPDTKLNVVADDVMHALGTIKSQLTTEPTHYLMQIKSSSAANHLSVTSNMATYLGLQEYRLAHCPELPPNGKIFTPLFGLNIDSPLAESGSPARGEHHQFTRPNGQITGYTRVGTLGKHVVLEPDQFSRP
jgi:hypothetical protein